MVIREGTHFRPRNGIRSWPHGELRDVSLALPRRGHGRIVLREGRDPKQAVSVFIEADSWSAAERIVGDIHARARASHKAAEADDPPGARSPLRPARTTGTTKAGRPTREVDSGVRGPQ